ncbi:MAG: DUF3488 domain-containing protein [Halobacteriovoraceae bacterium]|nr:DUF3488 domain-containing protein [Halobacteriovoraceae bacterium]
MNLLKKITPTFLLFFIFSFVLVFLLGEVENLFIYLGFLILFFQPWLKRAPRFLTNIALVLASLYLFVYYQFSLHPESALCFFLILTAFKFLQLHEQRDFYFLLHCHFLVIAGGALFNSNLYYMIFAILAIIVLIAMFQIPDFRDSHFFDREMFKNILQVFLMALPLFISLFIFFPRYRYFFPTLGSEQMGKIGYSGEINNSSISSLRSNGEAVMRVFVSNELPREQLYWRGRVLRITDGYNWRYHRTPYQLVTGSDQPKENLFKSQYYTLRNFQGDLIALDTPQQITSSYANFYSLQDKTFKTRNRNPQKNYTVYSNLESQKEKINPQDYLQLPDGLPEKVKSIAKGLASDSPRHYLTQIKQYLKENNFQYSLSPGSMQTLQDFLINKIGYCTHYSSLMGILLRLKGIPARLISGFQGGEYNELGQFYLLRSNDAHTWVEAYLDGRWERFDPTSYVEPLRIARGGQGFIEPYPWASSLKKYAGIDLQGTFVIQQYFQLQKFVDYVNTQVNLFFDNFNLDAQKELARKFKLNLKIFFSLAIVLPALFLMFLWLGLKWLKSPNQKDKIEATYVKFKKKLEKKGIPIESTWGPVELLGLLKNNREFAKVFEILELYIAIQYQSRKEAQLNKKFSKLVRQF